MIGLALATLLATSALNATEATARVSPELKDATERVPPELKDETAAELVRRCRSSLPTDVRLSGRLVVRNRKGIEQAEYGYVLTRKGGATELALTDANGAAVDVARAGRIRETDVTWSDLTLDYLWWDDFAFDAEKESETVFGQVCSVIVLKKEARTVRVWIDRKTGAPLQAEELQGGQMVRRMWGKRVKKFGDRYMANVLEVETTGSGHRTKITVEEME